MCHINDKIGELAAKTERVENPFVSWPVKILLIKQNQYLSSLHLVKEGKAICIFSFPLNSDFVLSVNMSPPYMVYQEEAHCHGTNSWFCYCLQILLVCVLLSMLDP